MDAKARSHNCTADPNYKVINEIVIATLLFTFITWLSMNHHMCFEKENIFELKGFKWMESKYGEATQQAKIDTSYYKLNYL